MAKKKSTKKDLELQIYEMHLRLNQINHYMTGIAEILNRYIDESEFDLDKNIIKDIFRDLYAKACEVE